MQSWEPPGRIASRLRRGHRPRKGRAGPLPRCLPRGKKKCNHCGFILPAVESFDRRKSSPDGLATECKICKSLRKGRIPRRCSWERNP
jgi:hypothetical protein